MAGQSQMTALGAAALAPKAARKEYPDSGKGAVAGLRLVVQPSGHKSWCVRYGFAGKDRKYTIGDFDKIALKDARKLAANVLLKVAGGTDPQAVKVDERRQEKANDSAITLGTAYTDYLKYVDKRIKKGTGKDKLRPKTKALIESAFKLVFLPKFKARTLESITKVEVKHAIDRAGDGPHAFAVGRTFFNWCREELKLIGPSPMDGLAKPSSDSSRDPKRVLKGQEIRLFWNAAEAMKYPFGPALQLLLLTGARRHEVMKMTRGEVDLDKREWTLPAGRSKNDNEHIIHLSDAAVAILQALPKVTGKAGYLFSTTGKTPVSGYSKAKVHIDKHIAKAIGEDEAMKPWTFHDLRKSCATGMGDLGIPIHVIEAALNHLSGTRGGLVGTYQHQQYVDERREAFQKWGEHVTALVSPVPA
jgi:integrase